MGCGSSQPVAPEQNAVRNGDVKRESPPLLRQNEQEIQPQPEVIRQESPKEKRKDSAKSSSSSSSSSSRSSSAKSKKSRPETAPGGNAPVQTETQQTTQDTEAPQSNNNKDTEEPVAVAAEEVEKVEEPLDETTTQGAVTAEESDKPAEDPEHDKPNFSEDVLKEFVEVENQVQSLEEKRAENGYQIKHARLVELHKKLGESNDKLQKLKAQTWVIF